MAEFNIPKSSKKKKTTAESTPEIGIGGGISAGGISTVTGTEGDDTVFITEGLKDDKQYQLNHKLVLAAGAGADTYVSNPAGLLPDSEVFIQDVGPNKLVIELPSDNKLPPIISKPKGTDLFKLSLGGTDYFFSTDNLTSVDIKFNGEQRSILVNEGGTFKFVDTVANKKVDVLSAQYQDGLRRGAALNFNPTRELTSKGDTTKTTSLTDNKTGPLTTKT